jgi:cell division protein FtsZ
MVQSVIKPKTTVLGIGGAGIKMAKALTHINGSEWLNIGVADADIAAINDSEIQNAFPVGIEWTQGVGCGGDAGRGERAFAHKSRKEIEDFIKGSSMLIVVGGLGGGSATGGAPVIGRLARRLKIPTIFVLTTPFSFEGRARHDVAESGLKMLLPDADLIIPVSNDILFTSLQADTPANLAFLKADVSIAATLLGIAEIMRCGNLLSTDFTDLKELLGGKKSLCHIALGASDQKDVEDRCSDAVTKLMSSPLLGGKEILKAADAMIITVIGGDDFQIGEMKQTLDIVRESSGENTRIVAGANTDPAYSGKIFITVIAINYDKKSSPIPERTSPIRSAKKENKIVREAAPPLPGKLVQGELAFQNTSRGHFTKTSPNIVNGEDIDIPPFQRESIILDKGI